MHLILIYTLHVIVVCAILCAIITQLITHRMNDDYQCRRYIKHFVFDANSRGCFALYEPIDAPTLLTEAMKKRLNTSIVGLSIDGSISNL